MHGSSALMLLLVCALGGCSKPTPVSVLKVGIPYYYSPGIPVVIGQWIQIEKSVSLMCNNHFDEPDHGQHACGYKPYKSVARCSPDCRSKFDGGSIWPITLGPLTVIATIDAEDPQYSQTKRFEFMVVEPTFVVCAVAADQSCQPDTPIDRASPKIRVTLEALSPAGVPDHRISEDLHINGSPVKEIGGYYVVDLRTLYPASVHGSVLDPGTYEITTTLGPTSRTHRFEVR